MSLLLLDDAPPGNAAPGAAAGEGREARGEDERAVRCAACGFAITTTAARIEVHGAHEHRRVNPEGIDFHLGCFGDAPGAATHGPVTAFWSWFPGFAWQVALCFACRAHLGWAFRAEDGARFFGLIFAKLVIDDER